MWAMGMTESVSMLRSTNRLRLGSPSRWGKEYDHKVKYSEGQ
jgi:hypothetical protein